MSNEHTIDKNKIVLGQCIRVKNVEKQNNFKKHRFDADEYIAIQIEDCDGSNEQCILLTQIEHTDMESVELDSSMVKCMVSGRLYPVKIGKTKTYLLKVNHWDGRIRILRISYCQLYKGLYRATNHPKSCTQKSALTDLFD